MPTHAPIPAPTTAAPTSGRGDPAPAPASAAVAARSRETVAKAIMEEGADPHHDDAPVIPYQSSAQFWLNFFFFCAEKASWFVSLSKPFWMMLSQFFFHDALRAGIDKNARWILGPEADQRTRWKFADKVLENFYLFIHDVGRTGVMTPAQLHAQIGEVDDPGHLARAQALGRGVIIATAHLGSFEVGVASAAGLGRPVHVVFQQDPMPAFNRLRHRLHKNLGIIEAQVERGSGAWMSLRDALARQEFVLIQGDRVMPGHRGLPVPFFGGHILLPLGPIKLAALTGAPILPVFAPRRPDGKVRLITAAPIVVDPNEVRLKFTEPPQALLQLAKVLEEQVRAYPDQWLMLHAQWLEDQAQVQGQVQAQAQVQVQAAGVSAKVASPNQERSA